MGKFSSLAPVVANSDPNRVIDSKTSNERRLMAHLPPEICHQHQEHSTEDREHRRLKEQIR